MTGTPDEVLRGLVERFRRAAQMMRTCKAASMEAAELDDAAAAILVLQDRIRAAEADADRLRAHIAANCPICRGTGIAGGSGSTTPGTLPTLYHCNHGLAAHTERKKA